MENYFKTRLDGTTGIIISTKEIKSVRKN